MLSISASRIGDGDCPSAGAPIAAPTAAMTKVSALRRIVSLAYSGLKSIDFSTTPMRS